MGGGKLGKLFLDALGNEDSRISYIIDNDENKQGKMLHNIVIYSYEEKRDDIEVVIVLNPFFLEEITEQVGEAAMVIDMDNATDWSIVKSVDTFN